jgi:hypothetical protein
MGKHVQAGEEAGNFAAGRRRAGVVPARWAGLPDADQPGSAEGDERGDKEGEGVTGEKPGTGSRGKLQNLYHGEHGGTEDTGTSSSHGAGVDFSG